jgi:hypothetical protein
MTIFSPADCVLPPMDKLGLREYNSEQIELHLRCSLLKRQAMRYIVMASWSSQPLAFTSTLPLFEVVSW